MEYKLKEVLDYIHNYFQLDTYSGKISIIDHKLENSKIELYDGQYYMIKGSIYNDGIWKYKENDQNVLDLDKSDETEGSEESEETDELKDEIFYGDVVSLRIPRDVLKIVDEINAWEKNNENVINGVYQSESFGGYSYTLKDSSNSKNSNISWKDYFGDRLKCYRKLG
jgi:hypothetical protein